MYFCRFDGVFVDVCGFSLIKVVRMRDARDAVFGSDCFDV